MERQEQFYHIQSSEIQEYIDEIYFVLYIFTSENIKFYILTPLECEYITLLDYL